MSGDLIWTPLNEAVKRPGVSLLGIAVALFGHQTPAYHATPSSIDALRGVGDERVYLHPQGLLVTYTMTGGHVAVLVERVEQVGPARWLELLGLAYAQLEGKYLAARRDALEGGAAWLAPF